MAEAPATNGPAKRKPPRRRQGSSPLRALNLAELDQLLTVKLGRAPRRDRLERDERAYRWVIRRCRGERTRRYRTTYTQAAKGLGYPTTGDRARDFQLFRSRVGRCLDSLAELGLIRYGGVTRGDGRWHCLEIELLECERPARARPIRRRRRHANCPRRRTPAEARARKPQRVGVRTPAPPSRIFFGPEVGSPYGGCSASHSNPLGHSRAREAPAYDGAASPPANPNTGKGKPGPSAGANLPSDHPAQLATLADTFATAFRRRPRFSPGRWHEPLARALRRLDRYADRGRGRPGAGAELARELIEQAAQELGYQDPAPARSLAYFVPILEELSKDWRWQHKSRLRAERRAPAQRGNWNTKRARR